MRKSRQAWIVLADSKHAKLLDCQRVPIGRMHIDVIDQLEFQWEGHEHGRPSRLSGKEKQAYASPGHEAEEELRKFAHEVAHWMKQKVDEHKIQQAHLFAPPRFAGFLRAVLPPTMAQWTELHNHDLATQPMHELHKQPAIRQLLGFQDGAAGS